MAKADEPAQTTTRSNPLVFHAPAPVADGMLTGTPANGNGDAVPLILGDGPTFDDPALTEALARAEPWAIDALYRKLIPLVRRVVSRFLRGSPTDADDLVQITFERVIKTVVDRRLDAARNLSGWAVTVATHAAIDHHRARERERRLFVVGPEGCGSEAIDPLDEERIEARSATDELMAILSRMRPLDAQVLLLRHGFGCSVPEIAERLGASQTAAGSRLVRAQRELLRRAAGLRTQL